MDGEVVSGVSAVDESMLTGEAAPVKKAPGAAVYGGTLNSGGSPLRVRQRWDHEELLPALTGSRSPHP